MIKRSKRVACGHHADPGDQWINDKGHHWSTGCHRHREGLERLVQNLLENGVRHNVPEGWVRVATYAKNGLAVLEVSGRISIIQN